MKVRLVDGVEVTRGSGNVFADLDLPDAEKLKIKTGLVIEIRKATCLNARFEYLLNEVLGLPAKERSALVVVLLDSLEPADHRGVSGLWRAEVKRRRLELRTGLIRPASWAEVRQRLSSL